MLSTVSCFNGADYFQSPPQAGTKDSQAHRAKVLYFESVTLVLGNR
jgi:hypothetical protein